MNGCIVRLLLCGVVLILFSGVLFAEERWVYRYNGPLGETDLANSIVVGFDGNVYAVGLSEGVGARTGFTVVSLTNSGAERWVYRFDGPGYVFDEAYAVAVGSDGNVYAGGYSEAGGTFYDFLVVSLTASGTERWVYRLDGPGNYYDAAHAVTVGSDGNIYAAGQCEGSGTSSDFAVVSLTASRVERWVYLYDGPGSGWDGAYSIIMGPDGNLYVAGASYGSGTHYAFTVISLTASGSERWVYRYDGPGNGKDEAYSIVAGSDGNLYAAGSSDGGGTDEDYVVVSLTASGLERWVYRYNGAADTMDIAYSIAIGSDDNLYVTGFSYGTGTYDDFAVVSVADSGVERWVYRYDGPGSAIDRSYSIAAGSDGNLYIAGMSDGGGTYYDFTIVSLTASGLERWIYRYNGPANTHDGASSIVTGSDGNLYAAGSSGGEGTSSDFMVVSLGPGVGVEEGLNRPSVLDFRLCQNSPNPFHHSTTISYSLPRATEVHLSIYDITGRLVETLVNETQQPGIHQVRWDRKSNPSGVYFYRLKACPERGPELAEGRSSEPVEPRSRRAGELTETRKMVVVE